MAVRYRYLITSPTSQHDLMKTVSSISNSLLQSSRSSNCKTLDESVRGLATKSTSGDEYDYVIVGAGSAGCTVANRLVLGDTKTRVLVTEAGPAADRSWKVRMPSAGYDLCVKNQRFDWVYETTPQKHVNGRRMLWPRGRVLGGSSSINGMIYIRGHPADYDRWAFKEGATGWSYAECLPYFIRSQKHELGPSEYRGGSGNLHVQRNPSKNPLYDAFVQAGHQAGYPLTDDFNGAQQEGFGLYDSTIKDGERASTAAMYLRPAMKEAGSRLTVSADTLVHRVIFNGKRAVGIEYQGGKGTPLKRAYATREVVLCGGAINSPQLLMLSGVGPADHLKSHDIQLVHHSPGVGSNLQDHLRVDLEYKCTKPVSINTARLPHKAAALALRWFLTSSGQLAAFDILGAGFVKSRPDVEHPDIQFHFCPGTLSENQLKLSITHGYTAGVNTLRETSRGTITLKSADPNQHPNIDPNYLDTPEDIQDLRAGVRIVRQVFAQRAFDEYRSDETKPGSACQSDSEIDAFVREKCETVYHPVGTCRMGSPENDDKVVVDVTCKVVGVEGLRVVDASVMPSVVSGNTNAPTIMIAERVSDMILGKPLLPRANVPDWKKKITSAVC